MKQTAVEYLKEHFQTLINNDERGLYKLLFEQALEMQDKQMQLTWNNAIDAVQKDKWESYDDFYNNNFK